MEWVLDSLKVRNRKRKHYRKMIILNRWKTDFGPECQMNKMKGVMIVAYGVGKSGMMKKVMTT